MNRSRTLGLFLLTVLLVACSKGGVSPTQPSADQTTQAAGPTPTGIQAILVELINQVDAHATPEAGWTPAEMNMTIYSGGQVRAAEASTARLTIEDSLVRVGPNTVFTLGQPSDDQLKIDLEEGQIWLKVEGLEPGQQFEVETPGAVAAVRGTRFSVRVAADQTTFVSVAEGQVDLTGGGQTVTVGPGLMSQVPLGGIPSEPYPIDLLEGLYWGMASGPDLEMTYPVYGEPASVAYQGDIVDDPLIFANDGRYFFAHVYEPSLGDSYHSYHDLDTGSPFTPVFPEKSFAFAFNPVDGRVAYWAYDAGYQVCIAQPDGSDAACFDPGGYFMQMSWSPDGTYLLYSLGSASIPGAPHDLYRVNPDGSDLVQLTHLDSGWNQREAWSPDGSRIAYVNTPGEEAPGSLWVMNADGSGQTMLFDDVAGVDMFSTFNSAVDWSPDGSLLAVPTRDGSLALVSLDGSLVRLVDIPGSPEDITWAPAGSGWPLAVVARDPENGYGLYLFPSLDAEPSWYSGLQYGPYWSADGFFLLIGVKDLSSPGSMPSVTTFHRLQTSPAFWP